MTALASRAQTAARVSRQEAPRRRGDLLSLLLLLGVTYCVAGSIHEAGWAEGTGFLIWSSAAAVLLGYWLALSPLPARLAAPMGVVTGLELVLLAVGNLWPPLVYVSEDLAALGPWLDRFRWGQWAGLGSPLPVTSGYVERQATAIAARVWDWGLRAYFGMPNADRRVWLLLVSTGLFLVALFAAWQVFRHWRPSLAVLVLGAAFGISGLLSGQGAAWTLTFLGLTLVLIVRATAKGLEVRWQALGTDYSEELLPYATIVGAALAVIALVTSPLVPALTSRSTYEAFWRVFREPWSRVEDTTGRLFGGLDSPRRSNSMLGGGATTPDPSGGHAVGAGIPQGDDVVMYVKTSDPAPEPWAGEFRGSGGEVQPQRHWRGVTYDTYTGLGWINGERTQKPVEAEEPLPVEGVEFRKEYRQQFRMSGSNRIVYAAGQPYRLEDSLTATLRDGPDLVSLSGRGFEYEAVSLVPTVTVAELRAAGDEYPKWVDDRYLALPPIPDRVMGTAREAVGDADNAYDKARAIEAYLRQFPYELNVAPPPEDGDVVEYFLFDLQQGYCDHFSTAMAVMLRAVEVPARVAVGFARGTYREETGEWVVTEQDSHAWVEVYFPEYGWIEFEPTPSQETYSYPLGGSGEASAGPLLGPPGRSVAWRWPLTSTQTRALVAGVVLILVLGVFAVRSLRRRRYTTERWIAEAYRSLQTSTSWVGLTPQPNETVREFWERLRAALGAEAIFAATPWGTEWVWDFDRVSGPARYILTAYERARFGPKTLGKDVARRAGEQASRLRREVVLLWVARRLGE